MTDSIPHDGITQALAAGVSNRGIGLSVGDARKVDGVDVLPVAFVSYGFGARDASAERGPGGGGAGGVSIPLGAYAVKDGTLRFRPNTIALASLLIPIIGTLGLAISMIIKALNRQR